MRGPHLIVFTMFNLSIRELFLLIVAKLVAPPEMPKQKNPQIEFDSFRGVYPELGESSECSKTNANYSMLYAGYVSGTQSEALIDSLVARARLCMIRSKNTTRSCCSS